METHQIQEKFQRFINPQNKMQDRQIFDTIVKTEALANAFAQAHNQTIDMSNQK